MIGWALAARLAEYAGAVVLFGAPLFFLYGLRSEAGYAAARRAWPGWGFPAAALVLLLGTVAALCIETATMTGDVHAALDPTSVWAVIAGSQFGLAAAIRIGLTITMLAVALLPVRATWTALTLLGGAGLASFAWTGHGAMDEGAAGLIHLGADLAHLWLAGVWLGALAALAALALDGSNPEVLAEGLRRFSGIGGLVVALLVASGLVNGWLLVGPAHVGELGRSPYGVLLIVKLVVFAAMLGFAVLNRYVLTARLGAGRPGLEDLRRSLVAETALGLMVLVLVAALGTFPPPAMG